MKALPTPVAAADGAVFLSVQEFEGFGQVPNRDVVAYYFAIRLPTGEESRLAVWFSGTVHRAATPEAFGLPGTGVTRDDFQTFALAAIGDFLDEVGLPELPPSGDGAAVVQAFSNRFQSWSDRSRASDARIEHYLRSHLFAAWALGLQGWEVGVPDYIRLGTDEADVARFVRLYEGHDWWRDRDNPSVVIPESRLIREIRAEIAEATDPITEAHTDSAEGPAFISYSHLDRVEAARVRRVLEELGIECFMAHDDIRVSERWKARIRAELTRMTLFVPLLSRHFLASKWTGQETGIAVERGVPVLALSLDGTTPYGFIDDLQGVTLPEDLPETFFHDPLARLVPRVFLPKLIARISEAATFRQAEALFEPLVPYLRELSAEEADDLARCAMANNQVWDANLCRREYLPALLAERGAEMDPEVADELRRLLARS